MNTKEKILQTSLRLFNKYGIDQVTVRDIAKEMGISHGNLCYHYPNTNDIIAALYEKQVEQFNIILDALEPNEQVMVALTASMQSIFELVYTYRFFYLNYIEIMRRIKPLKLRHYKLIEARKQQIRRFFDHFKSEGILRTDLSDEQYEFLIMQFFVYGDSWLVNSEVMYKGPQSEKVNYYVRGYMSMFVPYFTKKGKKLAGIA